MTEADQKAQAKRDVRVLENIPYFSRIDHCLLMGFYYV